MTKFRDGFMMKSPLPKHDAIMAEMKAKSKESSGRDDAPDFSNAEVARLKKDYDKAKAEHDSAAKMSPFQGYVDGEERVSHYQPTADLYKGMIDTITSSVDKIAAASGPENMAKRKAMKADRIGKRMDKIDKKQAAGKGDGMTLDDKRRKLATKQAEAKADQVSFENIANQNKNNKFADS